MNRLKLTIKKINSTCDFELSWSNNKTLTTQLEYPRSLSNSYRQWRAAYLHYYSRLRVRAQCMIIPSSFEDSHRLLRNHHERLLDEFEKWLLNPKFLKIERQIISLIKDSHQQVNLLIACSEKELTKLPWESWNIDSQIKASSKLEILRSTIDNTSEIFSKHKRNKPRILAILGSDPNLDFSQDKAAIQSLSSLAEITFIEQQNHSDGTDFSARVFESIIDSYGWDILFFIGHSNEADRGGEFSLTPNTIIKTKELKNSLHEAAKKGLQLAIFNSCSGIDIAEYLIELGLGQVVLMREPINDRVASLFLRTLTENLAQYKDIQTSLKDSRKFLARESIQQKYPSAYILPSLYHHPNTKPFQFKSWKKLVVKWLPKKQYKKILFVTLLLSLIPQFQSLLLESRLLVQYLYRQATRQETAKRQDITAPNPTLIVKVDEESLAKANFPWEVRNEMDREYLATLIERLTNQNKRLQTIGIDYILWNPKSSQDRKLKKAIVNGKQNNKQFVFTADSERGKTITPEIINPDTSLNGDIYFYPGYLELPTKETNCQKICPFAYLLALTSSGQRIKSFPENLDTKINDFQKLRLNQITAFNQKFPFIEIWFRPLIDYSLAPETIYSSIPAWCLLATKDRSDCQPIENFSQQIVIIAAGGYEEADDNFPLPISLQMTRQISSSYLTGGEIHAYNVHHMLNRHIITPIPDFLVIMLFAILAQGVVLNIDPRDLTKPLQVLTFGNLLYLSLSLQLYISLNILLPVFLPSVLLWSYIHLFLTSNEA